MNCKKLLNIFRLFNYWVAIAKQIDEAPNVAVNKLLAALLLAAL